jgi:outer membrane protein OmpA-like peptidoglycan-associated protein
MSFVVSAKDDVLERGRACVTALAVGVTLLVAGELEAQQGDPQNSRDLDLDTFKPVPRTGPGMIALDAPDVGARGDWAAGLFFHHAVNPLVVEATQPSGEVDAPIAHRSVTMLAAALSLGAVEIGASVPFIQQSGREPSFSGIEPANGATLGNLMLRGKARLFHAEPLSLGVAAEVTLPTSERDMFAGADNPAIHTRALLGLHQGPVTVVANAGALLRERRALADVEQGNEISYGLGGALAISGGLAAVAELTGAVGLDAQATQGVSPLELTAAIRYWPERRVGFVAGVGRGLLPGIGAPSFRGFALLSVAPRRSRPQGPAEGLVADLEAPPPTDSAVAGDPDAPFSCGEGDGPAAGCPVGENAPLVVLPDRIEIFEPVRFAEASAEILAESYNLLAHVAATLRDDESIERLAIEVHVHASGDAAADRELTRARAEAVRAWLAARGVARERLRVEGLGGEWPLVSGDDARARTLNERVELVIDQNHPQGQNDEPGQDPDSPERRRGGER